MDGLGIEDPQNVSGMSFLIDTTGVQSGFDPHELEDQITGTRAKSTGKTNLAQELENEIDRLTNGSDYKFNEPSASRPFQRPSETTSDLDELLRTIDGNTQEDIGGATPQTFAPPPQPARRSIAEDDLDIADPRLRYMTNEEKRQNVIGEVFEDLKEENGSSPIISIEREKEEDEKARKLEQINFLRETLEDEGEDLNRIPNVTHSNSLEEIDTVLRLLILKNDRKRCCSFAEECILIGAHGVEWAFDGDKSYFGHKPDMTDWHKSVQGKLRRMRHDTSNVVGNIMTSFGLGSGTRILLELIPSMFLYSRMRKSQHRDNLTVNDDAFNDGLNRLRDYEKPIK